MSTMDIWGFVNAFSTPKCPWSLTNTDKTTQQTAANPPNRSPSPIKALFYQTGTGTNRRPTTHPTQKTTTRKGTPMQQQVLFLETNFAGNGTLAMRRARARGYHCHLLVRDPGEYKGKEL